MQKFTIKTDRESSVNILWLSWKDSEHPHAGGAEIVKSQLCQRLTADGHSVIQLTGGFSGGTAETKLDGSRIIRLGNRWSVYLYALMYYWRNLRGWPDLVIDECNTMPFFASLYCRESVVTVIHQLAQEIWFYQMPTPLSWIGYFLEPVYLRLLHKNRVLTISESTRSDLIRNGFRRDFIKIIRMGTDIDPLLSLDLIKKYTEPTLLYLGSLRAMKRPDHVVKVFKEAREKIPNLRLLIAGSGDGDYFIEFMKEINASVDVGEIEYLGKVTREKKIELMQKSHVIVVTSLKEGWGLIVTEAASQGTPAAVYDVDGLRDSVKNGETGFVTNPEPCALAAAITDMLSNDAKYQQLRHQAWEWSKEITFDNSYKDFKRALNI